MGEKASTRRGLCFPAGACFSCALRVCSRSGKPALCWGFPLATRLLASRPVFLLVGGEELRHVVCRDLVHVACGVEVALAVVEGAVGDAFFGVCAIPRFTEVLCAAVDAAQRGFDGALVCVGCAAVCGVDCFVPFVVYEAGAVAFNADGDGHGVDVADVFGEVGLLLVGEAVPRVGERGHDGDVCGAGSEERRGFSDLVDVGVHGWVSFSLVVGVFSCVGFSVAHVWARVCVMAFIGARELRHCGGLAGVGVRRERECSCLRAAIGVLWVRACSSPFFVCRVFLVCFLGRAAARGV